jgi:hypothetical protein
MDIRVISGQKRAGRGIKKPRRYRRGVEKKLSLY